MSQSATTGMEDYILKFCLWQGISEIVLVNDCGDLIPGFLKSLVEKIEVDDSAVKMYYTIPMSPCCQPEETVGISPFVHHG